MPKIELRYGLPYVADIHVGIDISMGAFAVLGPATLSDIVIEGQYSTDPKIASAFSVSGAFRISAQAGLTLHVDAYAGLTILKHSINVGIGITGKAGIRGYAEAKPTLGYRETADPRQGKKGEFYLKGHMEIAAQPFLGLDGDFHIKVDSPWWSPAPDKTWTWPIGSLEYPLPGSFGIGADVDYVIGSDKYPDIQWGKADFDGGKFVDGMKDDELPKKSGKADQEKGGKWEGEAPAMTMAPKAPTAPKPTGKPAPPKAGAPRKEAGKGQQSAHEKAQVPTDPAAAQRRLAGLQALAELHDKAERDPHDEAELHRDLAAIKTKHGFSTLSATLSGNYWHVHPDVSSKDKPAPTVKADLTRVAKKDTAPVVGGPPTAEQKRAMPEVVGAPSRLVEVEDTEELDPMLEEKATEAPDGEVLAAKPSGDAKTVTQQILKEHKDAKYDPASGTLVLPHVKGLNSAKSLKQLGQMVLDQTGVSKVSISRSGERAEVWAAINPAVRVITISRKVTKKGLSSDQKRLRLAILNHPGKIVGFLKDMAADVTVKVPGTKQEGGGTITFADFAQLWSESINSEYVKDAFRRAMEGHHEWIPSNYILEVVENARDMLEGPKWIDLQHQLRDETFRVVFAPGQSPPATEKNAEGRDRTVPNGHVGAVYYPTVQQGNERTVGTDAFHQALRTAFKNKKTTKAAAKAAYAVVTKWVWNGDPMKYPIHEDCKDKDGNRITMARQRTHNQVIESTFDKFTG